MKMRTLMALLLVLATLNVTPAWGKTRRTRLVRTLRMVATAFTLHSRSTASGTVPHRGIVAADPAVLPLGSRIRITRAGMYNGIYIVTDTGNRIGGRRIDLYMRSTAEAKQFGRKIVQVQVLNNGAGKEDAREKDIPATTARR